MRRNCPPLRPPAPDGFAPVPPRRALARPFNAAGTRARIPATVRPLAASSLSGDRAPPFASDDSGDRVPRRLSAIPRTSERRRKRPACQRFGSSGKPRRQSIRRPSAPPERRATVRPSGDRGEHRTPQPLAGSSPRLSAVRPRRRIPASRAAGFATIERGDRVPLPACQRASRGEHRNAAGFAATVGRVPLPMIPAGKAATVANIERAAPPDSSRRVRNRWPSALLSRQPFASRPSNFAGNAPQPPAVASARAGRVRARPAVPRSCKAV